MQQNGLLAKGVRGFLWLLSLGFACAVFLRKKFLKKRYRPSITTISIGNLVAGGTGKTPFCIYLAQKLVKQKSVAIVLRGYKAEVEKMAIPILVDADSLSQVVGDEALIIARHVPEAKVIACHDKVQGVKMAERLGAECVLVDDGMQHIKLERDVEIVMLDNENPFGYEHMLPRGLLREPISALKRADLLVVTSRNGSPVSQKLTERLAKESSAPQMHLSYRVDGFYGLDDKPKQAGGKVGLFCAIAKPEQFTMLVRSLKFEVVHEAFFADHDGVTAAQLEKMAILAKSKGAQALLCTEKDRVKLKAGLNLALPIYWLKIGVKSIQDGLLEPFLSI